VLQAQWTEFFASSQYYEGFLGNFSIFLVLLESTILSIWPFMVYAVFKSTLYKGDITVSCSLVLIFNTLPSGLLEI